MSLCSQAGLELMILLPPSVITGIHHYARHIFFFKLSTGANSANFLSLVLRNELKNVFFHIFSVYVEVMVYLKMLGILKNFCHDADMAVLFASNDFSWTAPECKDQDACVCLLERCVCQEK